MLDMAAVYEEYAPNVYRFLLRRTNNQALADDLTAQVFERALPAAERYQERGLPVGAWLYKIARNVLTDHLRPQKNKPSQSLDTVMGFDEEPRVTIRFEEIYDREEIEKALPCLTADQRTVIEHRFLLGRSSAETAKLMGRTVGAVKKIQQRGLARMREAMAVRPERAEPEIETPSLSELTTLVEALICVICGASTLVSLASRLHCGGCRRRVQPIMERVIGRAPLDLGALARQAWEEVA